MFKNVVNLVKFKNQLAESKKAAKKQAKKEAKKDEKEEQLEKKTPRRAVSFQEPSIAAEEEDDYTTDLAQATTTIAIIQRTNDDNFLLRQGRKKFSTMARRLRRIKSYTARSKQQQDGGGSNSGASEHSGQVLQEKPRFVIDYDERQLMAASDYWSDSDDDDDDAYVSAEESLSDYDGAAGEERSGEKFERQAGTCGSDVQVTCDDKFIMEEELCDIPTFLNTKDCERSVIDETRRLLRERYAQNPDNFYEEDYQRMLSDDWTVSRFLLRRRLDPKRTAQLMENCGKFRKQYMMGRAQRHEFPAEFHLSGGLFQYATDRVGNTTMYMRIKMYRKASEINELYKSLILSVLEQCDVTTGGRGTAVVFDLTDCGLHNVDLGFLYWLLHSFRNFCPKGVSYILVLNLPWFLSATAKLAMTWMSATNRRALRFVQGKEIENFIPPENLPDYLDGTCKRDYRALPAGARPAALHRPTPNVQLSLEQVKRIKQLFKDWLPRDYEKSFADSHGESDEAQQEKPESHSTGAASSPVGELVSQAANFIAN